MYEKLAKLVVNYSLNIKKGERVIIDSPTLAEELIRAIYVELIKVGAHPYLDIEIEGTNELFYKFASEEQLSYFDSVHKLIYKEFGYKLVDRIIELLSDIAKVEKGPIEEGRNLVIFFMKK